VLAKNTPLQGACWQIVWEEIYYSFKTKGNIDFPGRNNDVKSADD
jgi:hypothetical protein